MNTTAANLLARSLAQNTPARARGSSYSYPPSPVTA